MAIKKEAAKRTYRVEATINQCNKPYTVLSHGRHGMQTGPPQSLITAR
jgi:hypothetical protein